MNDAISRLVAGDLAESREAIRFRGRTMTGLEWSEAALGYASALGDLGVQAGDRVAVLSENRPEVLISILGHLRSGVIHVPINTRYRAIEVAHILSDSGAAAVLVDDAHLTVLDEIPSAAGLTRIRLGAEDEQLLAGFSSARRANSAPHPDSTAAIIYTSGTTGKSKGVELSYRAIAEAIGQLTDLWQWTPADRLVLGLPLFHVHGLCIGVYGALIQGVDIELLPRFEARAVVDALAEGGSIFMGVPTMYSVLLETLEADATAAPPLRNVRLFTSGSAALPARDFERFERLTGHRILERYGMTETLLTLSNPYAGERRPGFVGKPVPGCETRVVGEHGEPCPDGANGELWVRWRGLMSGYWGQPEATAAAFTDGWFRTGDVVSRTPDGYFRIEGRSSVDIIKSGGFKISAREIEEVLAQHEAVAQCAVVGMPDPKWGQRILVAVVPKNPSPPKRLLAELAEHASSHLADFKKPRGLLIMDELPRNALGKLQKHRITEIALRSGLDAEL